MKNIIYENNLKALKKRGIANIDNIQESNYIAVEECKDLNKTVKVNLNEKNIYLHSKYNPVGEAIRFADKLTIRDRSIFICFGLGFGYHIREILKNFTEQNLIIVYEPDANIFKEAIKNVDLSDIINDARFILFTDIDTDELKNLLIDIIMWENTQNVSYITLPNYDKLYLEKYKGFLVAFSDFLNIKTIDRNTSFYFSKMWTNNLFRNMKNIFYSYNLYDFKEKFKDKTIVLVSAGPSLDKNVEFLKEIKGKILIVAVFRAVKVLLKYGIVPDMAVTIDGKQTGMEETMYNIPIIYCGLSSYSLLENHTGRKIFMNINVDRYSKELFKKYNKNILEILTGGSVACVSTDIIRKIGAKRIILIGQDLAYSNNKRHAEGIDTKLVYVNPENKKFIQVDNIYGEKVLTTRVLRSYIVWFEQYISEHKDVEFIDATEDGALIKGTKIMTLKEAIDKYKIDDNIDEILNEVYNKGTIFDDYEKDIISKEFINAKPTFEKLEQLVDEAIEISEKLLKICKYSTNLKPIDKMLVKLDDIDNKLNNIGLNRFLLSFMIKTLKFKLAVDREPDKDERIHIAEVNLEFYQDYKKIFEDIIPFLSEAISEIEKCICN